MYEIDLRVGDMDVVELVQADDGCLDFKRVVVPGGWRRFTAIISLELAESPELAAVLERVDASGGTWARDFGGCLTIFLPPGTTWDPMLDIPATGGTG